MLDPWERGRMASKVHLTKRLVDNLEARGSNYFVWDDEVAGFALRVTVGGVKSFVVDYTTAAGHRHRQTFGRYGVLTLDQARTEAKKLLGAVAHGADPLNEKQAARSEDTVRGFAAEYLAHVKSYKKPASIRADTHALEEMIMPKLGSRKLSAVTREDVARLHRSHEAHPYQANRMLATFGHLYTTAAQWGRVPQGFNPCHHVPKFRETKRERFLTGEELARLGKVLDSLEQENPYQVRAVRLLLLTGCRLNEILSLRWDDVDIEHAALHLRDAKAGPRDVPLGAAAIALLDSCARDSEWVIPSRSRKGRHLVNLSTFWHNEVILKAKLKGVRIHDQRHSVGGVGAGAGLSLLMISKVLGHSQVSTTERYAHLARGPLHQAADRISGEIAAAMNGKTAKVVKMPKRRRKAAK
jgi:integrase